MNKLDDNDKAKIKTTLIQNFDFDLAYKVAVMCDMTWWHSAHEIRMDALRDITTVLDEGYDECSSGGMGAYKENVGDNEDGYFLRFTPIESMEIRKR